MRELCFLYEVSYWMIMVKLFDRLHSLRVRTSPTATYVPETSLQITYRKSLWKSLIFVNLLTKPQAFQKNFWNFVDICCKMKIVLTKPFWLFSHIYIVILKCVYMTSLNISTKQKKSSYDRRNLQTSVITRFHNLQTTDAVVRRQVKKDFHMLPTSEKSEAFGKHKPLMLWLFLWTF